jgi:hypothetical protein
MERKQIRSSGGGYLYIERDISTKQVFITSSYAKNINGHSLSPAKAHELINAILEIIKPNVEVQPLGADW